MKVEDAIKKRRSVRNFKSKSVSRADLDQILEAARLAPSGTNIQPWRFVVLESAEIRDKLASYTLDFVAQAPAVIVCCGDWSALSQRKERIKELQEADVFAGTDLAKLDPNNSGSAVELSEAEQRTYLELNCAIAIEHMALQATELGLGSCWIKLFNQQGLAKLLDLDDNLDIVALLPIGYPAQAADKSRPRHSLDKLVIDRL
ncbi:MAG: nitroreductase family protein [Bacillota bacterium]